MRRHTTTAIAAFCLALTGAGCDTRLGWPEDCESWGTCQPRTTCSGAAAGSTMTSYNMVLQDNVFSCLVEDAGSVVYWHGYANTVSEAKTCATTALGDPDGTLISAYDIATTPVEPYFFIIVDYTYCDFGSPTSDPTCHQAPRLSTSAANAMSCVRKEWYSSTGDLRVIDVTSSVRLSDGSIDWGAWNRACPSGCFP